MKTQTKAILASILIVVVSLSIVFAYLFVYIPYKHSPEQIRKMGQIGWEEGRKVGKGMDEDACLSAAVSGYKTGRIEFLSTRGWLAGCLATSRTSDAFCTDIPGYGAESGWERKICEQRGYPDYCTSLMLPVQGHCHGE